MKAILRKELRQGRPLLIFSAAMALLLAAAHLVLVRMPGYSRATWETGITQLDAPLVITALALPLALALFAGIGLFAAEAEHGVLPVLFMLPLSRRRLWTAKLLAGALLTVLGSAAVLLTCKYLMPALFPFAGLTPWLDLALLAIFVLSVGMFVTVFSPHVIGAATAAVALGIGLVIATTVFRRSYGAPLLGYDELLEMELWLALTAPALLFTSWRALIHGELLEWRRTVFLHLPVLLVGLTLTAGLVCLAGRALTRYDRGSTGQIIAPTVPPGASTVALLSANRPVPYWRDRVYEHSAAKPTPYRVGWTFRRPAQDLKSAADPMLTGATYYRNHEIVLLDLKTGKELLTRRDSILRAAPVAAISPDGHYAALATAPIGATWGGEPAHTAARHLEVWDLRTQQRLYSGTPAPLNAKPHKDDGVTSLSWSPTERYLAVSLGWSDAAAPSSLYLMRPDGSDLHQPISGRAPQNWVWDRLQDVIYVAASGTVARVIPKGTAVLPSERDSLVLTNGLDAAGLSQDGRWFVLAVSQAGAQPWSNLGGPQAAPAPPVVDLVVSATKGGARRVLWEGDGGWDFSFAWRDGAFFALATRQERAAKDTVTTARLLRWRPGEARATDLGALPYPGGKLLSVADRELLVLPERMNPEARLRPVTAGPRPPVGMAMLDDQGRVIALPGPLSVIGGTAVTVDNAGRLLTVSGPRSRQRLVATDLHSGKQVQVYP